MIYIPHIFLMYAEMEPDYMQVNRHTVGIDKINACYFTLLILAHDSTIYIKHVSLTWLNPKYDHM